MNTKKIILIVAASNEIGIAIFNQLYNHRDIFILHSGKNKINIADKSNVFKIIHEFGNKEDLKEFSQDIIKKFSRIDTLISCIGDSRYTDYFSEEDCIVESMNINFLYNYLLTKYLVSANPRDETHKDIVFISSIYGIDNMSSDKLIQYSTARAALNSYSIGLAKLLAPIYSVNALAPGFVKTKQWEELSTEDINQSLDHTLTGKFVDIKEIANVVKLLLSTPSITGQIIKIDGGLSLKMLGKKV